jgi:hypothetical protein
MQDENSPKVSRLLDYRKRILSEAMNSQSADQKCLMEIFFGVTARASILIELLENIYDLESFKSC